MSGVRLSVALCTWNGAAYLEEQLESILAQYRVPDEVIACDDKSDDDSAALLARFAARAPFNVHIVVNEQRRGVGKNFDHAISLCGGDWIALCDQDDVWRPDKLAVLEQAVTNSTRVGAVFTNARLIDHSGRDSGRTLWDGFGLRASTRERFLRGESLDVLLERNVVTGAAMMFSAKYRDLVLPIPEGWIHDAWIALVIAAVAPVLPVDACSFAYREHGRNQIGVAGRSIDARIAQARQMPRSGYASQATRMRAVRDRLSTHSGVDLNVLAKFDQKIAHAEVRAALPPSRVRRLPMILSELFSGRYARYSSGPFSAIRDLLLS